jgi:Binding-protein-dependent transport system inner membrane component
VAEKIDPSDFQRVKNSGRAYITLTPGQRTMYLAMDYWRETGSPGLPAGMKNPFLDPRVCEAVLLAINVPAIFALPDMNQLALESLYRLDYPVVLAYVFVVAAMFAAINLIVDLLYGVLDPRVAYAG